MENGLVSDVEQEDISGVTDDEREENRGGSEEGEMKRRGEDDENSLSGEDENKVSLISSEKVDKNGVVREYEVALKHLGFGFFHILLLVINGIALSSDGVDILSISFIFPVLSRKDGWNLGSASEALLGSSIFMGMLVGSFVWGNIADIIGRRTTIILSLFISAIFGFFSAFFPWFWVFILFRFLSGFGVGGSIPVIIPYMSEFIRNKYRGPYLGAQVFFWMIGQLTCVALAWAIIPLREFYLFGHELESWRVFIAICALPSFIGALMYFFLPESPRFLLQVGKHEKALKALGLAYRLNHLRKHVEYPVKLILLDNIERAKITSKLRQCNWRTAGICCKEVYLRNIELFRLKFLRQTILLLIIIFCLSLGSYGILLWYPTYIDQLIVKKDAQDLRKFCNKTTSFSSTDEMIAYCGCSSSVFQDTSFNLAKLKKWKINEILFRNVTSLNVTVDDVVFNSTEFRECSFQNSTFTRVFFNGTNFNEMQFQTVNILPTSLCLFSNKSEGAVTLESVTLNIESRNFNTSNLRILLEPEVNFTQSSNQYAYVKCKSDEFRVYRDSFIVAVSVLPGNIVSVIAVYFFRRNYWLGFSMFVSAVSVFLLFIVTSETYVVAMFCLFNAFATLSWNTFNLIVAELYPTHLRSTAAGFQLFMARIGAIIGTNIFGHFVRVNPSIPILLITAFFVVGAVCALGVPTTTRKTLLK